uniref:RING-type domain-containing protein n=1 Tax=Zosterops lateralis melanops TaxID=1220523 RepID=A0A8D2QRK2_ZOSLA
MRFNKTKCKVLNLGQDNPQYQHRLGDEQMENSPVRRTWGCWWVREMDNCCPICLDSWKEISYILPCLHQFCYSCILQWRAYLCQMDANSFVFIYFGEKEAEG